MPSNMNHETESQGAVQYRPVGRQHPAHNAGYLCTPQVNSLVNVAVKSAGNQLDWRRGTHWYPVLACDFVLLLKTALRLKEQQGLTGGRKNMEEAGLCGYSCANKCCSYDTSEIVAFNRNESCLA